MAKRVVLFILGACFFSMAANSVYAESVVEDLSQLKNELARDGVNASDVKTMEKPLKAMLSKGATKQELRKSVAGLSSSGLKGKDLANSVNSMSDLVKAGEKAKDAGNVVSAAARQAKAQGLTGTDLAAKVREAAKERKQERQKMQKELKNQEKEMKSHSNKMQQKMHKKGK